MMKYDLENDGHSLLESIRASPIAAVISNPRLAHNPIVAVNAAFCSLTGYRSREIIGRNCKFLAGPATEPWLSERIAAGIREHRPVLVEIMNYRRDGTQFRNAVLVAPVFDLNGCLKYFIGSQVELQAADVGPMSSRHAHAVSLVKTLTPRQRQVLEEIASGHRSKQIAFTLGLSEKTVKMHRSMLLPKLGASNIADAVRIAVEAGL